MVSGDVPTPNGKISFCIDVKTGKASLQVPSGCIGEVGIPTLGTSVKNVSIDGKDIGIERCDGDFVILPDLDEGRHEFRFEFCSRPQGLSADERIEYLYTASSFREDRETRGDWKGNYGSKGFALFGYDAPGAHRIRLPEGCSDISLGKVRHARYASSVSDPRALVSPENEKPARNLGALVTGDPDACWQTMTIDVDYRTAKPYKVSLYFVDWDNDSRRSAIEVFDLDSRRLLAPVYMVRDYSGGVYVTFSVDRPIRIRVNQVRGRNASLSALFID